MAGRNKLESLKIEYRRFQVSRLYFDAVPQWEIAERLKVGEATVSDDLKALRKKWSDGPDKDHAAHQARELDRIDDLEQLAREAWKRSCKDVEIMHAGRTSGRATKDGAPLPDLVKSYKTVKGQAGDPRFLERVAWCVSERARILGLYAKDQVEHTGPGGGPIQHEHASLTNAERLARLAALHDVVRARRVGLPADGPGPTTPDVGAAAGESAAADGV